MGKFKGKGLLWWQSFLSPLGGSPKGHWKKPGVTEYPEKIQDFTQPRTKFSSINQVCDAPAFCPQLQKQWASDAIMV